MSRYRKVDPKMWGDAKFRKLSEHAKLLWIYLLTGPETTSLPGVLTGGRLHFAEAMGWDVEIFDAAFQEIADKKMAEASWPDKVVWIPNAVKYNRPQSPKVIIGWRPHWDLVPDCDLKTLILEELRAYAIGYGKAYAIAFAKAMAFQDQDQEQDQEQELSAHAKVTSCYFDTFESARGCKPLFGAIEGKHIKTLLAKVDNDAERACEAIKAYYADDWWKDKATIASIASDPSRCLGRRQEANRGNRGAYPVQRSNIPGYLESVLKREQAEAEAERAARMANTPDDGLEF